MVNSIEELIENRRRFLEGLQCNEGFSEGLHSLLTNLYPDTAHFIYELLQNAEDMDATIVRFILKSDSVQFEHNGTKRNFNLGDIDAITNISHNPQKRDDPTSIGKFGVGFKAVLAYTSTPEIHSGKYHFKIKEQFLPELEGVKNINTIDADGISWTKFWLPFNNPQKPAKIAYEETLAGLRGLNDSSILFLRNIRKIEYILPNDDIGYVERVEDYDCQITISCKKHKWGKESRSKWLRFYRPINITDDQGYPKALTIAVAYALKADEKTHKWKIAPVKGGGKTFIYFPAEKEYSGLRFHINAPFASTVARDSVRNCSDNAKLIKEIAKLVAESIAEIKQLGLLNHSFFEVLPNNKDELAPFYQTIFDSVYSAFQQYEYLPTKDRKFVSALHAVIGPANITNLFDASSFNQLTDTSKMWIANAAQGSLADMFLHSLNIQEYSYGEFVRLFNPEHCNKLSAFVIQQDKKWKRKFYALCVNVYDRLNYREQISFSTNFHNAKIICGRDEQLYNADDIFILPPNTVCLNTNTPIVDCFFIEEDKAAKNITSRIKHFFEDTIGVQEYGLGAEIKETLKQWKRQERIIDDHYFDTMLKFAQYNNNNTDVDFSTEAIFVYTQNGKTYRAKANELALGTPYNNDGDILAEIYGLHSLWGEYQKHYTNSELEEFLIFASQCGITKSLVVLRQTAKNPPSLFCPTLFWSTRYRIWQKR